MNLYTVKIKANEGDFDTWNRYHIAAKDAKQALDKSYRKFFKEFPIVKKCIATELILVTEDF